MTTRADFSSQTPFDIIEPETLYLPFVFNSPHSGRFYPRRFLDASRLNEWTIRRSEDLFVDELFEDMPALGAPLLRANFPRAYLDVNREPYELDPKMYDDALPSYANVRSIRVAGGLGTVARVVAESQEIYAHRMPVSEALDRVETLYKPYHRSLRRLLARTHVAQGGAFLIDCHSMPSGSNAPSGINRPDFVLGDRYGTSCSPALTEMLATLLGDMGYTVNRNKPYAGGFITEHYGRPATGLHALQLEINRGLYADEKAFEKGKRFEDVKYDLNQVFKQVFSIFTLNGDDGFEPLSLAAE